MMNIAATDPKRRALGKGLDSLAARRVHAPLQPLRREPEGGKPREIPLDQIDPQSFPDAHPDERGASWPNWPHPSRRMEWCSRSWCVHWRTAAFSSLPASGAGALRSRQARTTIPAILRQVSDEQAMEITIVENLQRADLNPMEQARAFERLSREFHMTQEQMAVRTGKDRATVANFLRLLRLPASVQARVESGELSFGHARTLLAFEHAEDIEKAAQRIGALSLSVRQTENYVQGLLHPERAKKKDPKPEAPVDPNVREVQEQLQRALGLKVHIEDHNGRGKVIIEYAKLEDFDTLLTQLAGEIKRA